ncbi:hypothetical protein [Halomonas sp. SpR8]|nr:hypothetical protein [Halomonas sp. SpR8]MDQ7727922.1 hypothetical protein [Halomonas sp. SpR8]
MSQAGKKDEKAPKHKDDHYEEANPMPDTHHVNPEADDDDSKQKSSKDKK